MTLRTDHREVFSRITGEADCTEQERLSLLNALADESVTGAQRTGQPGRRLALCTAAMPPTAELLGDVARMSLLSSYTAVADPSLYMAVLSHYILCLGSVFTLAGDSPQLTPQIEALQQGRRKGVFMVTEVGRAGSHLNLRTTAEFDPGTRRFTLRTPDAAAAKFSAVAARDTPLSAVVCARLKVDDADHGVFSFLVDLTEGGRPLPGVEISSRVDVSALPLDYGLVRFDGLNIPYERWLRDTASIDPTGAFHDPVHDQDSRLQRTLSVGQTLWSSLPSAMAAAARAAAVTAATASTHRLSHGRLAPRAPLLTYRPQQHAVFGALSEAFALTAAARTARSLGTQSAAADMPFHPAGTKPMTFSPWTAVAPSLAVYKALSVRGLARVATACTHRLGLPGLMDVNAFTTYLGLARAFESAGGDNQLIFFETGQRLVTEGGRPLANHDGPCALRFDDPWWWLSVAEALQHRLRAELDRELARGDKQTREGLDLWNPLLERARTLGEVHAQTLLARDVAETVDHVADPALRAVLCDLAGMYAVRQAQELSGTLLRCRLLSTTAMRELPGVEAELCDRLGPRLPLILQVMKPPEDLAFAPLSHEDFASALASRLTWHQGGQP
ncbi:acyl-CoA dehydrogenase [Streptomyces longwoodensis]|uniref:acyl-CoA dehydrogenase n=1 Tax=Streptomyces longwoodensis TaxID=68231 RepID=UPI0033C18266